MKKLHAFKKILALTVSAFMLAILPNANVLTVSAEEPTTYYIKYEGEERGWRYQVGSTWDDEIDHNGIDLMQEALKNGDIVVVGDASLEPLVLNAHLSNLTIANRADSFAMIAVTGGIDNCVFTEGSAGSVTGDVFNAYVYNVATANFCSNVTNLYAYNSVYGEGPTIGVTGTVGYYMPEFDHNTNAPYGIHFEADTFRVVNGDLETEAHHYTRDASGPIASNTQSASQPAASQPAASQPSASGSSASGSSADEYDAVPKTGETSPVVWLSLAAVLCSGISLLLRKSRNQ